MKNSFLLIFAFIYSIYSLGYTQDNHYSIQVKIDRDLIKADGVQTVIYENPNDFPLEKLYFRIHDTGDTSQCKIEKIVNGEDNDLPFSLSVDYQGVIEIDLKSPLKAKEKLEMKMKFSVPLRQRTYYIFRYLIDYWNPRAVPYYSGKLKPLNRDLASYRVEIEMPAEKTVVTSGETVTETSSAGGYKKVISQASHISNFGLIFFDEIQKEVRNVKDIKITNYYSPESAPWTEGIADIAANIVRKYLDVVGFYPSKVINIIPGSKTFTGGYPYASNIFGIHIFDRKKRYEAVSITAHEIAHCYWGFDYVLVPEEYGEWLKIALGIYTDSMLKPVRSQPYRWGYLLHQYLGFNTIMMKSRDELRKAPVNLSGVISHSKGTTVIRMLEYIVGKETFRLIFIELLKRYKYKKLTPDDFQKVCEEISGKDLDWFFKPWLYTNEVLDYAISEVKTKREGDKFYTQVGVKRLGKIPMPVEVEITTLDGSKHIKIFSRELTEGYIDFITDSGLTDVKLDPSEVLPLIERADDNIDVGTIRYCFNNKLYSQCLNFCEEMLLRSPEDSSNILYYQGRALKESGRYDLALQSYRKVIEMKEKDQAARSLTPWCYIRRGYIFDLQDRRDLALEEYEKALALSDYQGSKEEARKRINKPFKENIKEN